MYNSVIHCASRNGHLPIVQHLIEKQNIDINIKGKDGKTPLHYACEYGFFSIVEYLISKNADINVKDDIYICPTVSIGMSEYPSCALDEQTLIELADVALYNAKNNGKNCVCEYNPNTGCILLPKNDD